MADVFQVRPVRKTDVSAINDLVRQINSEFTRVGQTITDILAGRRAFTGDVDLGGFRAKNSATPKAARDLVTEESLEASVSLIIDDRIQAMTSEEGGDVAGSSTGGTSRGSGEIDPLDLLDDLADTGVVFAVQDASGDINLTTDATNLTWDDTNNILGANIINVQSAGAEATPSLYLNGDSNSGFWQPAGDSLALSMSAAEVMRWGTSEITINEDGDDRDFRIEGDTDTEIFFVDASTNRIGISYNEPQEMLHMVGGNLRIDAFNLGARDQGGGAHIMMQRPKDTDQASVVMFCPNGTPAGTKASFQFYGTDYVSDIVNYELFSFTTDGTIYQFTTTTSGTGSHRPIGFKISGTQTLYLNTNNRVHMGGINPSGPDWLLTLQRNAQVDLGLRMHANSAAGSQILLSKSRNTFASPAAVQLNDYLGQIKWDGYNTSEYKANRATISVLAAENFTTSVSGTSMYLQIVETGANNLRNALTLYGSGEFVFNEDSRDFDLRVESNGETHMFFVDGGNDRVGINESAPACRFHVDEDNSSAALPAMQIGQSDVDEPFIKLVGTAAAATLTNNIVAVGDVSTATVAGYVKIEVQDDGNQIADQDYFLAVYTLA